MREKRTLCCLQLQGKWREGVGSSPLQPSRSEKRPSGSPWGSRWSTRWSWCPAGDRAAPGRAARRSPPRWHPCWKVPRWSWLALQGAQILGIGFFCVAELCLPPISPHDPRMWSVTATCSDAAGLGMLPDPSCWSSVSLHFPAGAAGCWKGQFEPAGCSQSTPQSCIHRQELPLQSSQQSHSCSGAGSSSSHRASEELGVREKPNKPQNLEEIHLGKNTLDIWAHTSHRT